MHVLIFCNNFLIFKGRSFFSKACSKDVLSFISLKSLLNPSLSLYFLFNNFLIKSLHSLEIVGLLGNGSAYYAPAASLVEMVEAIVKDQRRILPAIAYLEGEYGFQDLYLGVPTILGANGIEKIIELELTNDEKAALKKSADSVKKVLAILDQ